MSKRNKIVLIVGSVEVALLIFALVVSILVWTTRVDASQYFTKEAIAEANVNKNGAFLPFFQNNSTAFFFIICFPLFLLIALDFVYLGITALKKDKMNEEEIERIKQEAREEALNNKSVTEER